jgi:predicted ATPase
VGETPNLAAALHALAAPGQVVLAESTRRLLGAAFDLKPLDVQLLDGIAQPVAAFLVHGEHSTRSRFEARTGPSPSAMVGRTYELAALMERWMLAQAGEGQAVLLVGEAGIGKSRLTRALLDAVAAQPHVRLRYQCSPYHADSPLWPLIQHLAHAIDLQLEQSLDTSLDRLEALLDQAGGDTRAEAPLIAALVGLDGSTRYGPLPLSAQELRSRTLEALVGQALRLAARQPVLMIVEDTHWIDPTTLELIERVLERIAGSRLLIILTSRPDHQTRLDGDPQVARLTLNRLDRVEAETIVAQLGGNRLPHDTMKTIVAHTDGVPLFLEELTKAVLETGQTSVPASLHDSLMARLDRVPQVKDVAQIAACIGREFDHALLAAVAEKPADALDTALGQLIDAELIFRRGVPPSAHYTFKHALVQDAAYESLLRSRRQQLHARILEALESNATTTAAEELARHAAGAELTAKAIDYWRQAGEVALKQSAYHEAAGYFGSAIKRIETQADSRQRREQEMVLQVRLGNALTAADGYGAASTQGAYARAYTLFRTVGSIGDATLRSSMFYGHWTGLYVRGEFPKALRHAKDYLAQAEADRSDVDRLVAHRLVGTSSLLMGELTEAQEHLRRSLEQYDPDRHRGLAARHGMDTGVLACCHLAWVLGLAGASSQARVLLERADQLMADVTNVNARAIFHSQVAVAALGWRDAQTVRHHGELLAALAGEYRMPLWNASAVVLLAWATHEQNRPLEAIADYERGMAARKALKQVAMTPFYCARLAVALAACQRADEALWMSQQAIVDSDGATQRWCMAELWRSRGDVFLLSTHRDPCEATRCFEHALSVARSQGARQLELRAATSLATLLLDEGKRQQAHDLLAPVHAWFTEGFDTADLQEAAVLLQQLD